MARRDGQTRFAARMSVQLHQRRGVAANIATADASFNGVALKR